MSRRDGEPNALGRTHVLGPLGAAWRSGLRLVLVAVFLSGVVAGCASEQVTSQKEARVALSRSVTSAATVERWERELIAIRAQAEPVLAAMSDYGHHLSFVAKSRRTYVDGEPAWDPPMDPSWEELQPSLQELNASAAALHAEVASDVTLLGDWRFRRALAEATHRLLSMTEAMHGYYDATKVVQRHEDDDISTRPILNSAWDNWAASQHAWSAAMALRQPG